MGVGINLLIAIIIAIATTPITTTIRVQQSDDPIMINNIKMQ